MTATPTKPRIVDGLTPAPAPCGHDHSHDHHGHHGHDHSHAGGKKSLPVIQLDKRTYDRALDCVHCGLCLPACPTYTENGLEADSPRGRIYLMKSLADGKIEPTPDVVSHLDLCLDCRACETACPSGVVYHELLEETRAKLTPYRPTTFTDRFVRAMFLHVFTRPTLLKLSLIPVRVMQKIGVWRVLTKAFSKALPAQLDKMQQMLPPTGSLWESNLANIYHATGQLSTASSLASTGDPSFRKITVGFFAGCVGSVLFQQVNRQTIRLLQHAGCDVVVAQSQGCCGAIHHHAGEIHGAEAMARKNIDAFFPESAGNPKIDFVVNNISGCGAMLKDYAHLLRDDPKYAQRAADFTAKTKDISSLLVELKPAPPTNKIERTVTYHDACHLAHGQKVTGPPRELLSWIPGLKIVTLRESDMCCGAAGTYNLTQPAMARDLAERKIGHIKATGAKTCVTANVGCAMQIQSESARVNFDVNVTHPVSILHEAYFGPDKN